MCLWHVEREEFRDEPRQSGLGPRVYLPIISLPSGHKEASDLLPRAKECGEFLNSIKVKTGRKGLMIFVEG